MSRTLSYTFIVHSVVGLLSAHRCCSPQAAFRVPDLDIWRRPSIIAGHEFAVRRAVYNLRTEGHP